MEKKIITLGDSGIKGALDVLRKLNMRELSAFDRLQIEQEKGKCQDAIMCSGVYSTPFAGWTEIVISVRTGDRRTYRYKTLSPCGYPHNVQGRDDGIGWFNCPSIGIALRIQREIPLVSKGEGLTL